MNFCDPILCPKILCNKPCADGFELERVLASHNNGGFVTESFIRPPVNIEIIFCIPVHIANIEIGTKVGSKCCCGISIFAAVGSIDLQDSSHQPSNKTNNYEQCDSNIFSNTSEGSSDDICFCLGKWYTNQQSKIVLKNHHYKHWVNSPPPVEISNVDTYSGSLKNPNRFALMSAKRIVIRILKSLPNGPPCIKYVRIWGQPGVHSSPVLKKAVVSKWTAYINRESSTDLFNNTNLKRNNDPVSLLSAPKECGGAVIPDEFLDPLTCELMVIPLLLPSGNAIDMHTLERYIQNEAQWGRSPSDPFTGVLFTNNMKPEPDVHLKARIDRFILTNNISEKISSQGQTLTSTSDLQNSSISTLPKSSILLLNSRKRRRVSGSVEKDCGKPDINTENYISGSNKNSKTYPIIDLNSETCEKLETASKCEIISSNISHTENSYSTNHSLRHGRALANDINQHNPNTSKCHRTRGLINSLGSAIAQISQRPSKVKSTSKLPAQLSIVKTNVKPVSIASSSSTPDLTKVCICGNLSLIYELRCGHIICRKCLDKKQAFSKCSIECKICGNSCESSEIERIHPASIFTSVKL